jgi:hypothetical protein
MSNDPRPPVFDTETGEYQLGFCAGRFDERQRRERICLPEFATCWDYAPLIDVVRKNPGSGEYRYTGKTAAQWMADLRNQRTPEYDHFRTRYKGVVDRQLGTLARRPRKPDNHYCVELAVPPLKAMLPSLIRKTGLKRASVAQWRTTIRALTGKGLKTEELEMSGVLAPLQKMPEAETLTLAQVLNMIDLSHVVPKFASESRFGFVPKSGWKEECRRVPEKEFKRRRLLGYGYGAQHLIRYRHRSLGWAIVYSRYRDLVTEESEWWSVLDEHGLMIQQSVPGFRSAEDAMAFAELQMSVKFATWGKDQRMSKWERFSLLGGDDYQEILLQLDDWPYTYQPRHYRTRNVLVHIRTSVRRTQDGRRVLFLDEIQSDWHSDLHVEARSEAQKRCRMPTPQAPFRREWPLLSMKLMIWWAQRLDVDGLSWSSAELQKARWGAFAAPEILYRKILPDAARSLAATLSCALDSTLLLVRSSSRRVKPGNHGWEVHNRHGTPVTKPFRTRAQAECFADLTGEFFNLVLPVLWIDCLPPIESIPLYGTGDTEAWFNGRARRFEFSERSVSSTDRG